MGNAAPSVTTTTSKDDQQKHALVPAPRFSVRRASEFPPYAKRRKIAIFRFLCCFQRVIKPKYPNMAQDFVLDLLMPVFASYFPPVPFVVNASATGSDHALLVDGAGLAYAFGSNTHGQIGNGRVGTHANRGVAIMPFFRRRVRIRSVACGGEHSVCIDSRGGAFTFGRNTSGQLGLGDRTNRSLPFLVQTLAQPNKAAGETKRKYVVSATAGSEHTIFMCLDGSVHGTGGGLMGQAGRGVRDVSANDSSTLFTLLPERVLGFEEDDDAKLDDGENRSSKKTSVMIDVPSIVQIAAGSNHTLAIASTGALYSWGSNLFHQLGHSAGTSKVGTPIRISGRHFGGRAVVEIDGGFGHSIALTDDGRCFCWGTGTSGQLGLGAEVRGCDRPRCVLSSDDEQRFVAIAAGDVTSYALTSKGDLFEWGASLKERASRASSMGPAAAIAGLLDNSAVIQSRPRRMKPVACRQISSELDEDGEDDDDAEVAFQTVRVGSMHASLLTRRGVLYTYGYSATGALGVPVTGEVSHERPKDIRFVST